MLRLNRVFILLWFALITPGLAHAESLTQVMFVRQGEHATSYTPYHQFDPSLGTLTQVTLDFTQGIVTTPVWTFRNLSPDPVTATDTIHAVFFCGLDTITLDQSFLDQFQPEGLITHQVRVTFTSHAVYTGSLDRWVGLNVLDPDSFLGGLIGSAGSDGSGIGFTRDNSTAATFVETITYNYSPSVPAPSSWLMLTLGLTGCTVLVGSRHLG